MNKKLIDFECKKDIISRLNTAENNSRLYELVLKTIQEKYEIETDDKMYELLDNINNIYLCCSTYLELSELLVLNNIIDMPECFTNSIDYLKFAIDLENSGKYIISSYGFCIEFI